MKTAWEVSADPTYSPRNLILSGITGFVTVILTITGYIFYITYSNWRLVHDLQPKFSDLILFFIAGLIAFGSGVYLTYLLRRLLTEYIPSWISSSFIAVAILLYPVYIITYFEMGAGYRLVEACDVGEPPEDWRTFLVFILISIILFCITSTFSGVVTHLFSARRNAVPGLR